MFNQSAVAPSHEKVFLRHTIFNSNLRLDGRGVEDIRAISIQLMRNETSCSAEVQWGNTIVIAVVSCRIIAPFPDKPNEGVLHFNTELSAQAEVSGYSHAEISRLLEKTIRESETLDTESLCIVNGEKVWEIHCEVRIVDASGGNIIDASVLASIAALKGFRKPEISVTTTEIISQKESKSKLIVHHSDERDPLPLALHHTPLTLSVGVFRKGGQSQSGEKFEGEKFLLIVDPSNQEENAMDGIISFSINSFSEICAIHKPGGISLPVGIITKAGFIAMKKIELLHQKLEQSLQELEVNISTEREIRLNLQRQYRQKKRNEDAELEKSEMEVEHSVPDEGAGIDKNDPILQWSNLHFPVQLKNSEIASAK